MIFLEALARPMLVAHALLAATVVGATTHQVVWTRSYFRGDFRRHRAERRFVWIAALAYTTVFVVGNLLYPIYKVRVRSEYFDNPRAVSEAARTREAQALAPTRSAPQLTSLATVSHAFDIKEHAVALGYAAILGLWWLSRRAHPRDVPEAAPLYLGLSIFACLCAWTGIIVGLYTASVRAVGS